ncbi:MAG TPA: NUDIX domain-containing protein [Candidatus Brocadiia bacterium]|nr:NUDIX domain-containing protein [Candidatus Brocadiia bacterium]
MQEKLRASQIWTAVDVLVLSWAGDKIQALLIERGNEPYKGRWALPGGFVEPDESLEQAAARETKEETGIQPGYLEQIRAFGAPDRDPRGRVISVAFLSFVPFDKAKAIAGSDAARVQWFPIDALPTMAFEHAKIISDYAVPQLRAMARCSPALAMMMPSKFTIPNLRKLYETILGEKLNKKHFRQQLYGYGVLEWCNEFFSAGVQRPARLYRISVKMREREWLRAIPRLGRRNRKGGRRKKS